MSDPSEFEKSLSEYESTLGCLADERSFSLEAYRYVGFDPPKELLSSTNWSFIPDTQAAPGMIGFGSSPSDVIATFELPCPGKRRILDIEYLVSYEGMGVVHLTVAGTNGEQPSMSVVMDGLWTTPASLYANKVLHLPDETGPIRVTFELLSPQKEASYSSLHANAVAVLDGAESLRGDRKFKVVRMQCC